MKAKEYVTIDGIKAIFEDSWILVRPSGTEPLIRIFVEAESKERAEELIDPVLKVLKERTIYFPFSIFPLMTLPEKERVRISKLISGILRHFPQSFGISLDEEGFVEIEELVEKIREHRKDLHWLTKDHVLEIVQRDEKGRFEVRGGKIRARYGHTLEVKLEYEEDRESKILYHGTSERSLRGILREGIKAMRRRYVHLSVDPLDAIEVGRRHGGRTVVLIIDVECLRRKGHPVFYASKKVRLTDYVPPECISGVRYARGS